MADPGSLSEIGKLAASAAGGGGLVFIVTQVVGGLAKGWLSGTTGQDKDLREGLAERVATLETRVEGLERRLESANRLRDSWRYLCLQARLQAERLGFDPAGWPADPKEEP